MRKITGKAKDTVMIGLFAVLLCVCSVISLPGVIPLTLQSLGVFLALSILGGKRGTLAICVYLVLGLVGLPVFSGFGSGVGALAGPTGGYLLGWIPGGLAVWLTQRWWSRRWVKLLSLGIALTVCYISGTAWFMTVYTRQTGPIGLWTALGLCVLPFIIPDLCKLAVALWLSQRLGRISGASSPANAPRP